MHIPSVANDVQQLRSAVIEVSIPNFPFDLDDNDNDDEVSEFLNTTNLKHILTINRGDIIHIAGTSAYRNNNKFIWNGTKFLPLDFELDEYGSVPRDFTFPEFPIGYFTGLWSDPYTIIGPPVTHNFIHHIDMSKLVIRHVLRQVDRYNNDVFGDVYACAFEDVNGKTWTIASKGSPLGEMIVSCDYSDDIDVDFVVHDNN